MVGTEADNWPEVTGREVEEARRVLEAAGVTVVAVTETLPPRAARLTGALRVVRQRASEEGVRLVVAASVPLLQDEDGSERDERGE